MVETIRRHPTAFAGMGFLLLFVVMVPLMVTTNAAGPGGPPPSEVELSDALWRAGLDPESLTTAIRPGGRRSIETMSRQVFDCWANRTTGTGSSRAPISSAAFGIQSRQSM